MVTDWRRKKITISSGESKFNSKETTSTSSFNSRACSAKKVMQETKSSSICSSESCPVYVTLFICAHTPFLAELQLNFKYLKEKP